MLPINDNDDVSQDELSLAVVQQLVAYDEAKATGKGIATDGLADDSVRDGLACVDLLHRVWPDRESPAIGNENPPLKTLGDFRLIREFGRGGMGTVFEAEQISMGRHVALKVLPFAALVHENSLQRFRNEVRAAAALNHPHIVPVYSIGEERGVHFYAMQLIRGQTLSDLIGELRSESKAPSPYPLPKGEGSQTTLSEQALISTAAESRRDAESYRAAARLGIQAAEALQHAHDQGVLHRDIKPSNLLLDAEGKLYVTDFGLARIEADAGMTMTGDIVGTLRYMAPEQALAKRVVIDHRADVYSLGATLYELLTLQPAFGETDRSALLKQIAFEDPLVLRKIDRYIPAELETIVLKAMAKNPDERYETAQGLADDLRAFLAHRPIKAKPPTLLNRAAKWSRRHVAIVWAAASILLVTTTVSAVGAVLVLNAYERESAQRRSAEAERERAETNFKNAREAVFEGLVRYGPTDSSAVGELNRVCDALMGRKSRHGEPDDEAPGELLALAREFVKRNPQNVLSQYYLGLVLAQQKQFEEAFTVLREADRSHPNTPFILDKLAWKLAICPEEKFRDPQAAIEFAERAVKLSPQNGVYWNTLGVAYYRAGDWQRAIGPLRKASELPEGGGEYNVFFLAMCYWRLGDQGAARKWYAKCCEELEKYPALEQSLLLVRAETEQLLGYAQAKILNAK